MTLRRRARALWLRYARSPWEQFRWPAVAVLWLVALLLGYWGFGRPPAPETWSGWDKLYRSLQLYVLESGAALEGRVPLQLEVARLLAPTVAAYTAVGAAAALLRDQVGRVRARLMRRHVLICGLGRCGRRLTRKFLALGYHVVAIEGNDRNPAIAESRKAGVVVLIGDGTDRALLRRAGITRAKYVVVVCGNDSVNLDVALATVDLLPAGTRTPVGCFVQIVDAALREFLSRYSISSRKEHAVRLEPFDMAERGVPLLLAEHPPFDERVGMAERPHPLIVGGGETGCQIIVHSASRWRAARNGPDDRLPITLVDVRSDDIKQSLEIRYPSIGKVCEIDAVPIDVGSAQFQRADFLLATGTRPPVTSAFICLDDDTRAIGAGLSLRRRADARQLPIIVRLTQRLVRATLPGTPDQEERELHLFPMLERTCTPEVLLRGITEILAQAIHERYVRKERAAGHSAITNPSMVGWDSLPEELKESNRHQADDIGTKLESIGCDVVPLTEWDETPAISFTAGEVEVLAQQEHERWCLERKTAGWTHGPTKNIQRKRTPWLVPWGELPEDNRAKDRNTVLGMPAFLATVGLGIVRKASSHRSTAQPVEADGVDLQAPKPLRRAGAE